jgi:uncharacterized protein (DUF1499 family)
MFAGAMIAGLAAAGTAAVALAVPRLRTGSPSVLIFSLLLGLATAAVPLDHVRRVKMLPYINDITTDTENPPQFAARVPKGDYAAHFSELQRIGYPELRPLELTVPPGQAFARAQAAAQALGWEIVGTDQGAGRIEAVVTTRWFGFKDDVVVRIAAAGGGSRIDVRSRSRVGRSDLGANAKRIQEFLTDVMKVNSFPPEPPRRAIPESFGSVGSVSCDNRSCSRLRAVMQAALWQIDVTRLIESA